jgi:hypothetical protein
MLQRNSAIIRCEEFSGFHPAPLSRRPGHARTTLLAVPQLRSSVEGTAFPIFLTKLASPIFRKARTDALDSRENTVRSLVMRAKLLGFRFWLNGEVLEDLRSETAS